MKKSTAILIAALAFFVGVVNGFVLSPIKKGVRFNIICGNNNGPIPFRPDMPIKPPPKLPLLFGKNKKSPEKGKGKGKWNGRK